MTWFSLREKEQSRPASSSLVPLNHLSLRGVLPFTMAEKVTLEPGIASIGCGCTTKDGGSVRVDKEGFNLHFNLGELKHLDQDLRGFKYLHREPEEYEKQAIDYFGVFFLAERF